MSKLAQNKIIFNLTLIIVVSGIIPISGCRKIGSSIVREYGETWINKNIFKRNIEKQALSSYEKFLAYEHALEDIEKTFKYHPKILGERIYIPSSIYTSTYKDIAKQLEPDTTKAKSVNSLDRMFFCENNCDETIKAMVTLGESSSKIIFEKGFRGLELENPAFVKEMISLTEKIDAKVGKYTLTKIGKYTLLANRSKRLYFICRSKILP